MQDFEQRISQLEKQQEELDTTLAKLEAVAEIQYLMGQMCVYQESPLTRYKLLSLYADRDDSSHESYTGYYVGMDALRKYFGEKGGFTEATGLPEVGTHFHHHLASPTITVADDLQTARGMWWSPGCETLGGKGANGAPLPLWCYAKYNNDFIKVDGKWKLWHTHFYVTFMTPFNLSWVDVPEEIRRGGEGAPGARANSYNPLGVYQPIPEAPQPYETWTDDRMRP